MWRWIKLIEGKQSMPIEKGEESDFRNIFALIFIKMGRNSGFLLF